MRHIYIQARKMRQGLFEIDVTEYDIKGIIVGQLTPVVFFLQPDVTWQCAGRICHKPPCRLHKSRTSPQYVFCYGIGRNLLVNDQYPPAFHGIPGIFRQRPSQIAYFIRCTKPFVQIVGPFESGR